MRNFHLQKIELENIEQAIMTRKMSFFINHTLSEIEDKNSQLIDKKCHARNALSENGELQTKS